MTIKRINSGRRALGVAKRRLRIASKARIAASAINQDWASIAGRSPNGAMKGFDSSGVRPFASNPRKLMPTPMSVPLSRSTARCQK
jgi:hypothetical protein